MLPLTFPHWPCFPPKGPHSAPQTFPSHLMLCSISCISEVYILFFLARLCCPWGHTLAYTSEWPQAVWRADVTVGAKTGWLLFKALTYIHCESESREFNRTVGIGSVRTQPRRMEPGLARNRAAPILKVPEGQCHWRPLLCCPLLFSGGLQCSSF